MRSEEGPNINICTLYQFDLRCFPLLGMLRGNSVHTELQFTSGSAAWSAGVQVLTFVTKSKVHCLKQSKYCGENCSAECTGGSSATVTGQEQDGPPISLPTLSLFAGHI